MLELLYIFTIAFSCLMTINRQPIPFFIKYGIAFVWIVITLLKMRVPGTIKIRIPKYLKDIIYLLLLPIFVAFFYTLVLWIIGIADNISFSNITRLISNLGCLAILILCAIMISYLFDRNAIYYTFYAIIFAIGLNFFIVLNQYGIVNMMNYLKNVFVIDSYDYYSVPRRISYALELHDPTFALGIFLIFFVIYEDNKTNNHRWIHILICLLGMYIGFKRNSLLGFGIAIFIAIFIIRKKSKNFIVYSKVLAGCVSVVFFCFVVVIKYIDKCELFQSILDVSRIRLYKYLATQIELTPFFLGKGFSYVNYTLGNNTMNLLGTSHSDLTRIYVEMGFWGFFAWIWYFFVKIPNKLYNYYSVIAGKIFFVMSFYVFATFFLDNTLTLFANQYAYYVVPISIAFSEYRKRIPKE